MNRGLGSAQLSSQEPARSGLGSGWRLTALQEQMPRAQGLLRPEQGSGEAAREGCCTLRGAWL